MEIRPAHAARTSPVTSAGIHDGAALFGPVVEDTLVLSQYVGAGQLYKMEDARFRQEVAARPPLAGEARVRLARPFLMVPGWTTERERFAALSAKLTEGGLNGGRVWYVKDGEFFQDFETTKLVARTSVPPDARVFEVILTDSHAPPPQVASELHNDLEAIRSVTGAGKVDVDAYSMGGLGTRLYLDRGGTAVGRLMMVGTPNQGTRFAELARHIISRDIHWAMAMGGLSLGDLPALQWMSVDDGSGGINPRLEDLNSRWAHQRSRTEAATVVGGQGQLTPASHGWQLFTAGDGLVPVESLALPGTPATVVDGQTHHGFLNNDAAVYREMVRFFGWTPEPPPSTP